MSHGAAAAAAGSEHDEELSERAYDGALMRRFLAYARPYRGWLAGGMAVSAALIALELAAPLVLKSALDGPVASGDSGGLARHAALFGLVILLQGLFRYGETWITSVVGQRVVLDVRLAVFEQLQRLSLAFYDRNPVGRLVTRVTSDVEALKELLTSGLIAAITDAALLLGISGILFAIDARLALVTLSMVPPLFVIAEYFRRAARVAYRDSRRALSRLNSYLQENISGMRVVQSLLREARNADSFRGLSEDYLDAALRTVRAFSVFFPTVELLGSTVTGLLLWYGGLRILEGSVSLGTFLAFWFYAQKFIQPVRDLSEKYNLLQSAMAAAERIFKLLDTAPEVVPSAAARAAGELRGEIEFRDVWFAYRGEDWVLKGVSFRVAAGESVALVGATGAGKSTLVNLLFRFYDVQRGAILVDGVDVREYDLASYRRNLGLVLQDVFLFSGDVASNLRLGKPGVSDADLVRAAEQVHAHEVIARLPGGYAAEVKERGASFSVGERQLLSFARAVVFDPRVLVLDEATSSIDAHTESLVQDALRRLLARRTSLIIAHRLSTVRDAHRILVFHHGVLVESGTHGELLRTDGIYARLYRLQFGLEGA
ncbi:MAG: ABC transporter ATP-binding protein [Planctomycetes bacterium]|nr:ABC transporter ATP-binding protein [Planctomycetota bacterium]